ncbi:MAG: Ig-like domain-containing protein [Phycisphaerales bacterium]
MSRKFFVLAALSACGLVAGCNTRPLAMDDHAVVPAGSATTIAVLDNDRDPNGDPMIVKRAWGSRLGAVSINPDNTITYAANPGVTGMDTFTYRVADNRGRARNASVLVDVTPERITAVQPLAADILVGRETVIVSPPRAPAPPPTVVTTVERGRILASPEPTLVAPAPAAGPFVESVLVILHTTADDKNREEPVRIVLRRGNEILADRTVGGGELWGSFTDNVFELILRPQPPIADASRMVLDLRKVPAGGGQAGGGWTMQAEARARLTDGSTAVLLPMTEPVKFGDDATPERNWTLTVPR